MGMIHHNIKQALCQKIANIQKKSFLRKRRGIASLAGCPGRRGASERKEKSDSKMQQKAKKRIKNDSKQARKLWIRLDKTLAVWYNICKKMLIRK